MRSDNSGDAPGAIADGEAEVSTAIAAARPGWRERVITYFFGDDVFISYARYDGSRYAQALARALIDRGISFYLDQWSVTTPGAELPPALRTALRRSMMLVVVATEAAKRSPSVEAEIELFLSTQRKVMPVCFTDSLSDAIWFSRIEGLPPVLDSAAALASRTPSADIVDDIDQSTSLNRRSRRLRRSFGLTLIATLAVAAIAAVVVGGAARQTREFQHAAQIAKDQADEQSRIAQSRRLANQAVVSLQNAKLDLALLTAVEAYRSAPTFEARDILLKSIHVPFLRAFLYGPTHAEPQPAMSADGKVLIAVYSSMLADETAVVPWDLEAGRKLPPVPEQIRTLDPRNVAIDPAGVIVALEGYTDVVLWNRNTSAVASVALEPWTSKRRPGVSVLTFSPDGRRLAVGRGDGYMAVIDPKISGITKIAHPSNAQVAGAAFSADAKRLVFVDYDGGIFEAAMAGAMPVRRLPPLNEIHITRAAFSPELQLVAFLGGNEVSKLKLWNLALSKREPDVEIEGLGDIQTIDFAADGRELIVGGWDSKVVVWDVQQRSTVAKLPMQYGGRLSRLTASRDGKMIAVGSSGSDVGRDNTRILVWDRAAPREPLGAAVYAASKKEIRAVSRSGAMLAFVQDNALWLLRSEGGTLVKLSDKADVFGTAAFSPDERLLITGAYDEDGTLRFWDTQAGTQIGQPIAGHRRTTSVIAFSPDGRHFATGGSDREIAVWNTSTRQRVNLENVVHREGIAALAFSHEGHVLASAGADATVQVWDASMRKPLYPAFRLEHRVSALTFSPDDKILAASDGNDFIHLWDATTGAPQLDPFKIDDIRSPLPAFSPDGKVLVLAGKDRSVALWDIDARQPLSSVMKWNGVDNAFVDFNTWPVGIETSCAGKCALMWSSDGSMVRWSIDADSWVSFARRIANRNLSRGEFTSLFGLSTPYHATFADLPAPFEIGAHERP